MGSKISLYDALQTSLNEQLRQPCGKDTAGCRALTRKYTAIGRKGTMERIVECVPNISEGRRKDVIEAVVDEVRSTPGVTLLDYSSDESHNRSVITFIGEPNAVVNAAVKLAKKAAELIDLTKHTGEHPRMGAVDVIPLIPIRGMTGKETIELSKKAGRARLRGGGYARFSV